MTKMNGIIYSEYLHIAHDKKEMNGSKDRVIDMGINLYQTASLNQDPCLLSQDYPLT